MPTYEYECRSCGHSFEKTQSMSEEAVKDCPKCGKDVRRIIFGGAGVIFKGSGFYVNDSRGKNPAGAGSSPSGESKTSSGDSKPAAAESKPDESKAAKPSKESA